MKPAGKVPEDVVRRIRRVHHARKTTPSDKQLAAQHGIHVRMVRAIGRRELYRGVPD